MNKPLFCILDRDPKIADDKMKIKRTWLPDSPSTYPTGDKQNIKGSYSVEVSSYYYIKKYHNEINIELIPWERITDQNFMKKYDKVFIFNHGLSDAIPFWKSKTKAYVRGWKNLGDRAWPSFKFASFVLDKCKYYRFLKSKKIKTADTFCIKSKKNVPDLKRFLNRKKIDKIFIKPIGGNSGLGTSSHDRPFHNLDNTLTKRFINNKFKKLVVQRFMNFSTHDSPEYKCLYVGGKLQYVVKTFRLGFFNGIIFPTDKWWKHMNKIDILSKKVIRLFSEKMKTEIPFCRVDWGYDKLSKNFFLNEFEHAGGTYGEEIIHKLKVVNPKKWTVDVELAKAIVKFVADFKK